MIRRNNSAEFSSGLHGGINFRFKNWFRQKCRNNTISAEITFIRPKWGYFGRNYSFCQTLPDLAYVSRLVRCVMQDGGRELIYLYGSHTSYWSNVGVEIATAYLYCHVPRDEVDGGKIGGVLKPEGLEWNKFQLIFCIYHLDIFPSMTVEWQPRPFPFSICYDVIVMCIRDVMPSLLALNFSFYGPTLDFLLNIYHKQCFTSQLYYLFWPK